MARSRVEENTGFNFSTERYPQSENMQQYQSISCFLAVCGFKKLVGNPWQVPSRHEQKKSSD
jgi:hypothetical protein